MVAAVVVGGDGDWYTRSGEKDEISSQFHPWDLTVVTWCVGGKPLLEVKLPYDPVCPLDATITGCSMFLVRCRVSN